jgi:hypothetical protein
MSEHPDTPARGGDLDHAIDTVVASLMAVEPRAGFEGRVLARLRGPERAGARSPVGWRWVAAAGALALTAASFVAYRAAAPPQTSPHVATGRAVGPSPGAAAPSGPPAQGPEPAGADHGGAAGRELASMTEPRPDRRTGRTSRPGAEPGDLPWTGPDPLTVAQLPRPDAVVIESIEVEPPRLEELVIAPLDEERDAEVPQREHVP